MAEPAPPMQPAAAPLPEIVPTQGTAASTSPSYGFGLRADRTPKGSGFLGVLKRPDGDISTELSVGVNIDGKEIEVPTLVPTLTQQERDLLLSLPPGDASKIPRGIIQKASTFAAQRIAAGKSPFADNSESPGQPAHQPVVSQPDAPTGIESSEPPAVQSWVDPGTGLRVSGINGKAAFHVGDRIYQGDPATILRRYPGAQLASPADIQHRLELKAQDTVAGQIKAGAKSLAGHAFDASTALIRVPAQLMASAVGDEEGLKQLQNLTGQGVMENVSAILQSFDESNKTAETAAREYREATKAQFEANPQTRFAAGIAGDIGPGIAMGALGTGAGWAETVGEKAGEFVQRKAGEVAAKALTGAVEAGARGVGFGANTAAEDAYIDNSPLTRQKLWTGALIGGALGAGIGGGLGALGQAFKAGPRLAGIVAGPGGEEEGESALSKALGANAPDAEHAQAVAEQALAPEGVEPAPGVGHALHELLSDVQAKMGGAEKEAYEKYGPTAILDRARRGEALDGWTLARQRPQIIEQATKDISANMATLEQRAGGDVFEQVRDLGLKRDAWAKLLDPEKRGMQVDAARGAMADIRSKFESMLAEPVEPAEGTEAAESPSLYGDEARIKSALGHARRAEKILAAEDVSGEDAAITLDEFKRSLGKLTRGSAKKLAALRQSGDFAADSVFNTAKTFSEGYESVRQTLMNQDVWGKAADAQQEINKGWENWIDSRRMYSGSLMRSTGERESSEILGFRAGQRYEIDPDKVGSWLDKFGTGRGKLNDQYIRAHLDATEQLANSIGKYVDTGKVGASVQAVKDAAQAIKLSLATAERTVGVSNQINSILTAQGSLGAQIAGGAVGLATGGALGGALGTALGAIANPGRLLRTAMAIQGLASTVDDAKGKLLDHFFEQAVRSTGKEAAVKTAKAAGSDAAWDELYDEANKIAGKGAAAEEAAEAGSITKSVLRKLGKVTEHTTHTLGEQNVEGALEAASEAREESRGEHVARGAAGVAGGAGAQFYGGKKDKTAAYNQRRDQLAALTSNPVLLAHQTQKVLGSVPGIAPQLASALSMDAARNLQMLQGMAPPASAIGGLFSGKLTRATFTPERDMDKFAEQWDGVMHPLSVLSDLNEGKLSLDKVAAARLAHPELFADIASDFLERMTKLRKPLSHQAAVQADLLLGLNGAGEPSVEPGFLARINALNQVDQQDQKSAPTPRPPANIAKGAATLSQSLEGA